MSVRVETHPKHPHAPHFGAANLNTSSPPSLIFFFFFFRYTRSDEQSIRDLVREQERLTGSVAAKRRELEREATETSAKQVELDKCAEEFRALHEERKDLIVRLEEALASITARDREIASQGGRHVALRQAMAANKERIAEIASRLSNLERENREMEVRQEAVSRARGEARDRVITWTARVNGSRDELETIKGELVGTSHELQTKRAQNAQWEEEIVKRQAAVEHAKVQAEELKVRRTASLAATASVEDAVAKKEAWLKKETLRVEKMEKEVAGLKEAVTSGKVTLSKLLTEVEVTKGEIKGAVRASKNLRDRLAELDVVVARQAEHSYSADFAIAQMERKVCFFPLQPPPPTSTPLPLLQRHILNDTLQNTHSQHTPHFFLSFLVLLVRYLTRRRYVSQPA